MDKAIQRALTHLQNANYTGYFEEMDKAIPANMRNMFNQLQNQFIAGKTDWDFSQKLENYAKRVEKAISQTNNEPIADTNEGIQNIYQHLESNDLAKAIKEFLALTRGTKHYNNAININIRYKEYLENVNKNFDVSGKLEKISNDFVNMLQSFQ